MHINEKVRGALLLGRLRYVRGLGALTARRILDSLEGEDRKLLEEGGVRPAEWYSARLLDRLDGAIAATSANGNREAVLVAIGQSSAEVSFGQTGALHHHAGKNDPHALLKEVSRVHAGFQGAGERGYARVGARSALLRSVRGHRNGGGDCLTNVGWLRRAIELCGGRDAQVFETACIGRGGSCCEYRCEWR
jgi:hypothetical protein